MIRNNNDLRPIVPYNVYIQEGFDNVFINGRDFIYLSILEMSLTF